MSWPSVCSQSLWRLSFRVPGEQNRHAHRSVCADCPHIPCVAESARGSQVISWELVLQQVKLHSSKYTFLSWGSFSPFSFPLPPLPSPHDLSFQAGSLCVAQAGLEFPVLCLSLQVWSLWVCAIMSGFRFCICFFGFLFFLTI